MKNASKIRYFVLGMTVCLVVMVLAVPAMASNLTKTAQLCYNNIKITLNGNMITPKDASANIVEPFIIDGTTYLPVRAISGALGLGVDWDSSTNTVVLTDGHASPTGTTLYENNGIKITYLGIGELQYGGEEIKLFIENTSSKNYTVQTRNESVNGLMANPVFSCTIAAGKSAYDSIEFDDYMLKEINVTSINNSEFYFHIYNDDSWSDSFDSDVITVNK